MIALAGCGGATNATAPDTSAAPAAAPTATPEPKPEDIAFVDSLLIIVGDTGALVVAGEVVEIDHLVRNTAGKARSAAFRADTESPDLIVELSDDSRWLKAGEIEALVSVVTIPDDAQPGQV